MEEKLSQLLGEMDNVSPVDRLRNVYERATNGAYTIDDSGNICAVRTLRDGGESLEPVSDFCVEPLETVKRDDGLEQSLEYGLKGYDYKGRQLPLVRVPASKFSTFSWITESWPGAVIRAGQTKKERLRECVQMVERETATRRIVYSHSGWRQIDGQWCFLYDGGAIGCDGCSVELPGNLSRYNLDEPTGPVNARDTLRMSLQLLELAPYSVTVPLLATMYAAPLARWFDEINEPIAHVLLVHGRTQSKKSTATALFLSHFGQKFTHQTLPCNFQSTGNAIRGQMFAAADLPLAVDDFHPAPIGRRHSVDTMTETAQTLVRSWGDHADRQRMNSDGATIRRVRPARGIGVITAEFLPDLGESGLSRCYVVQMSPESIKDLKLLTNMQNAAAGGVFVKAMRTYIEWLSLRVGTEDFAGMLKSRFAAVRSRILQLGDKYAIHGRLATSGAHLNVAFSVMLDCFVDNGVLSSTEANNILSHAFSAIIENLSAHEKSIAADDPIRIFAACIEELLDTDGAFLPPHNGAYTDDRACGFSTDGGLYIFPKRCFAAISEMCRRTGSSFPITERELWRRLFEGGYTEIHKAKTQRVPGVDNPKHCIRLPSDALLRLCGGDNDESSSKSTDYPY